VATIAAIQEEHLLENSLARGVQLMTGLRHLQEEQPRIGDVRGLGLMVGAEFTAPDGKPDQAAAKQVVHECLDNGLMLLTCGPWDNTIRLIPPLTVSEAEIKEGLTLARFRSLSSQRPSFSSAAKRRLGTGASSADRMSIEGFERAAVTLPLPSGPWGAISG
jgi:acetylornithine/succinyldiaminopimelate/putrescine aminotransferase